MHPSSFLFASLLVVSPAVAAKQVLESAREIPIAYDVDVVVVGGTTGAVSAAVEAAGKGAKVFLAAPRPYLGEDIAGTLRLWLEPGEEPQSPLERAIFDRASTGVTFPNQLDFTYEANQVASSKHPDSKGGKLHDGTWATAAQDSVQYDADVTIVADLGKIARVKDLHFIAFERSGEFEIDSVVVATSPNGKLWRELGDIGKPAKSAGSDYQQLQFSLQIKQPSRYVKLTVRKPKDIPRILLGEIILTEDGVDTAVQTESKEMRQPPTPMQAKVALDKALIDAGVTFLYGSPVTDLLRDSDGKPAGVVIANRSGRQAVRAKVVIDATARAGVARKAGAEFSAYPASEQVFKRIVVGGVPREGEQVREVGVGFNTNAGPRQVFEYTLKIPMKDGSLQSFAEAEMIARDRTFDVGVDDEADTIFQVPPDTMAAEAAAAGDGFDPASVELAAFRPKGVERVYVIGGSAGVSRPAAEQLLRPLAQMRVGVRVGVAAAELAAKVPALAGVEVHGASAAGASDAGEVKEFLGGVRPTDRDRPTTSSKARGLPVLGEYDVVVIGGGTGGAPAGIGAARKGAKTLVVEYQDHLGGVGTLGLISSYYHGYRKGFTSEVDEGVAAMGGPKRKGGWNPVAKREYWRREIRAAGGEIWFSSLGCGALVDGNTVVGAIVSTPFGRGVVLAKSVIDSTGNTDIAVAAGAGSITTSAEHIAMQGTGLSPKGLGVGYTNTDYSFSDESDPVDQWRMIVAARQKYKNSYDLSTFIDSRERRRIVGDAFVSPLDIINDRKYHDTIALHDSNFDTHGYTVHPVFLIDFPDKKGMLARVPYRAMLPKGIDGILVTGLGISAHRDSMPILRMQPCIQNQGYAAGYAAATVAAEGKPPRSIDMRALQEHLVEIGSLPATEVGTADSTAPPAEVVAAAVKSVVKDYRGLAVLLDQKEAALPLLREAYAEEAAAEDKLVYANILGMLGDPSGAGTLIEAVRSQDWDTGWNFRGMGQFGGSISRLDSHIIALGRSGAKEGLAAIFEKVAALDASKEFSHHRAVAMALEEMGDKSATAPLADLLSKEGMSGFAIVELSENTPSQQEQRSQPLREIILARALYRCGDRDGLGEKILRAYEKDLRGLFARHAQGVLEEPEPRAVTLETGL